MKTFIENTPVPSNNDAMRFSSILSIVILAAAICFSQAKSGEVTTESRAPLAQRFHKQLSQVEKQHILDGSFSLVMATEEMPPIVKQAFTEMTGEQSFALANPDKKYQVTDVVIDRNLPFRRLVFAGVNGDKWFIHYERGGRGHSYSVLVFRVEAQKRFQFLWGGAGGRGAKNLEELRQLVAVGQFSDELENRW